jgi:hypothetical protein
MFDIKTSAKKDWNVTLLLGTNERHNGSFGVKEVHRVFPHLLKQPRLRR